MRKLERNSPWSKLAQDENGFLKTVCFEIKDNECNEIDENGWIKILFDKLGGHMVSMLRAENQTWF